MVLVHLSSTSKKVFTESHSTHAIVENGKGPLKLLQSAVCKGLVKNADHYPSSQSPMPEAEPADLVFCFCFIILPEISTV